MDDANRFDCKTISTERAAAGAQKRHPSVTAATTCGIAVMAKASAPGRTKTRLVPPLTFDEAAALNTAFLQDVTANLLVAARHTAIAGYAAMRRRGRSSTASCGRRSA
jgi:hypothetical protein